MIPTTKADLAILICKLIPAHCPFERDVVVRGHKLFHVPPLCKLNPAYGALISLRFRALAYLERHCPTMNQSV